MFDFLIDGFGVALTPLNLGLAFLGALLVPCLAPCQALARSTASPF